jgi:hypothetical protein
MITFFTIPKAFKGLSDIIQRNAIRSWVLLPGSEVIILGDDEGTAEVAKELGVKHIPGIERSEYGTPLLSAAFAKATEAAGNDILCYANADIILLSDFMDAVNKMPQDKFLLIGQRTNLEVKNHINFEQKDWEKNIRGQVIKDGRLEGPTGIDYFVFPKGQYRMPPFAVGRPGWDNWFIYHTRSRGIPVIDATGTILAIHQRHDYSFHPQGRKGIQRGVEAERNLKIAGRYWHLMDIRNSTHQLSAGGIQPVTVKRKIGDILMQINRVLYPPQVKHLFRLVYDCILPQKNST